MPLSHQQDSALERFVNQLKAARIEPAMTLRLAAFCAREEEEPSAVLHDALSFYLDWVQHGDTDFTPAQWGPPAARTAAPAGDA
jgi:hypothetical protein